MSSGSTSSNIKREKPIALYYQIAEDIKNKVHTGILTVGTNVPTESELRRMYDVSPSTVKAALNLLIAQGILRRDRGRRPYIVRDCEVYRIGGMASFTQNMIAQGWSVRTEVLRLEYQVPPELVRKLMHLKRGLSVVFLKRLKYVDSNPLEINEHYIPKEVLPGLVEGGLQRESLYEIFKKDYGLVLVRAEEIIEPIGLDTEKANLLQVEPGSPGLRVNRTVYNESGQAIDFSFSVFAAGGVTYYTELRGKP